MGTLTTGIGNVTRGLVADPDKILLYGAPGAGKSTWASKASKALFLDLEGGTHQLDVARIDMHGGTVEDFNEALDSVLTDGHDYKTLVIDTLDALAVKAYEKVAKDKGWETIDAPGFAKGEKAAAALFWIPTLRKLDEIRDQRQMEIVILAHAAIQTLGDPQTTSFIRWIPRLDKYALDTVIPWANVVLFAQIEQTVTKQQDGKGRARTSGKRVLRCEDGAAWMGKNRHHLPATLPLDYEDFDKARKRGAPAPAASLHAEALSLLPRLVSEDQEKMAPYIESVKGNAALLAQAVARMREKADANDETKAALSAAANGGI